MRRRWRIRKGDQVIVCTGKSKGMIGEVLEVLRSEERVLVKGVNMVTKHQKPSTASAGGLIQKEAPLHVSNVMHVDPKTNKPTRIGVKFLQEGRKVLYAKKSGEVISQ